MVPFRHSSLEKKEQVAGMFNDIAHRYDFSLTASLVRVLICAGEKAIRLLKDINLKQILDVATGTADMAILAHRSLEMYR